MQGPSVYLNAYICQIGVFWEQLLKSQYSDIEHKVGVRQWILKLLVYAGQLA